MTVDNNMEEIANQNGSEQNFPWSFSKIMTFLKCWTYQNEIQRLQVQLFRLDWWQVFKMKTKENQNNARNIIIFNANENSIFVIYVQMISIILQSNN
jgi:hypothetical protein